MSDERVDPRPVPPTSRRAQPKVAGQRKQQLADAFLTQGAAYDALRPGYPPEIIDAIQAAVSAPGSAAPAHTKPPAAADLGAGTGKLSRALAERGFTVTAIDPSEAMLQQIREASAGSITTALGTAESTGLPDASQQLVTAAQAWHWFDRDRATSEIVRILEPGGVVALVWNMLNVSIPWVHRYSRIMHAGDVQREGFLPDVGTGLELVERVVHHWEDQRSTQELIDLALTRSYTITASEERRQKVLANLDWYLHEHLGHAPGSIVGMSYRTDLFLYRRG